MGRSGEIWGAMGRYGEIWGDDAPDERAAVSECVEEDVIVHTEGDVGGAESDEGWLHPNAHLPRGTKGGRVRRACRVAKGGKEGDEGGSVPMLTSRGGAEGSAESKTDSSMREVRYM